MNSNGKRKLQTQVKSKEIKIKIMDMKQRVCMTMMPIHGQKTARKVRQTKLKLNRTIVFIVSFVKKCMNLRVIGWNTERKDILKVLISLSHKTKNSDRN